MKKIFAIFLLSIIFYFGLFSIADAIVRVRGYVKPSTGRYVAPSYRTSPNKYKWDNYSTRGNINPYTGKKGYKSAWDW